MEDDNNDENGLPMEFNDEEENSQTLTLSKLQDKINLSFDYEVNSVKLDENYNMNCKLYYYNPKKKSYQVLNYNAFNDKLRPLPKIVPTTD